MISPRLFLLGTTLCLGACMSTGLPTIRPAPAPAMNQETLFERAYDEGKEHLAAGRAGLAIVAFERAVRLDPTSVNALNGIGAAYDDLKRYDIALAYYKRALRLAPQSADTVNNIAVSLRLAGDPAANEWLARAAKLDPANGTIAANIVQAQADDEANQKVHSAEPPETPAAPPATTVDAGTPTLRRSGAAEFLLESPSQPPASNGVTDRPAPATLIPVVATIDPPAPSRTETHDAPTVAPIQPRPIAAVALTALPVARSTGLPSEAQINVSNCVGRTHMARRFGGFLAAKDLSVRHITNAPTFDCEKSRLLARAGFEFQAEAVAHLLPVAIAIENNDTTTDDIRLVLGRDLVAFDRTLGE